MGLRCVSVVRPAFSGKGEGVTTHLHDEGILPVASSARALLRLTLGKCWSPASLGRTAVREKKKTFRRIFVGAGRSKKSTYKKRERNFPATPPSRASTNASTKSPQMVVLSNEAFLTKLGALFAANQSKGSVFVTQKTCECSPLAQTHNTLFCSPVAVL